MTAARFGVVVVVHALAIWALCAATMAIGLAVTSLANALLVHAVVAPVFATAVGPLARASAR